MPLDFDSIQELEIHRAHFSPTTLYLSVSESITHSARRSENLHAKGTATLGTNSRHVFKKWWLGF